jgi:hypothetical protein
MRLPLPAAALALMLFAMPLSGQRAASRPDTAVTGRRPRPLNYFLRSLLIPGWGQASLHRKLTGGIFVAVEGLALGMALKTTSELHFLERTDTSLVDDKRGERQDWIVVMVANHLFAGLEAYVSANLFDFPGDLRIRALPGGRTGIGLSLPIRP